MSVLPGTRLGPYEILEKIGAGGMGEVFRASDTRLHREVAIKVSAERFTGRFEREARAVAALNQQNICTLHDVGPNYLVMELVEGETLAERIKRGKIPLEEALAIARQIANALDAAHEKGIVHRDLKPGNIKIKPDGAVKVLDFGLAKIAEPVAASGGNPAHSPTLTLAMATNVCAILGTAGYITPEQARGKNVDKRADIFAFGVVLYEMLRGGQLFEGETVSDTLASVLKQEPDWSVLPANTPAHIRLLLRRCLEKDPSRRLRDIGDASLDLYEKAHSEAANATAKRIGPIRLLSWALAGALVVALAAVSFIQFRENQPHQRVLHLSVPLPANSHPRYLALSPDGRRLVVSLGVAGKTQLWLRSLDSPQFQLLPGTDSARTPFWSADSRSIGSSPKTI